MLIHKIKLADSLDNKDFNLIGRKVVSYFLEQNKSLILTYVYFVLAIFVTVTQTMTPECKKGRLGGVMVLSKLPRQGCPTNLDYSRAKAYCASRRCGLVLFSRLSFLFFLPLSGRQPDID